MKLQKTLITLALGLILNTGNNAYALGVPVIDAANLAQALIQVQAWTQQYTQMQEEFNQLQREYSSLNGVRGMADLVNTPEARQYLPSDYQDILSGGYGTWEAIRSTAKVIGIEDTMLNPSSDAAKAFEASARQAAINRATMEDGYKEASYRFDDIQVLLEKINAAPDAKDIADLQARIQAEQVMLQNESIKLAMLGQLAQAQRDLANQRATEIGMKSTQGSVPRF